MNRVHYFCKCFKCKKPWEGDTTVEEFRGQGTYYCPHCRHWDKAWKTVQSTTYYVGGDVLTPIYHLFGWSDFDDTEYVDQYTDWAVSIEEATELAQAFIDHFEGMGVDYIIYGVEE